MLFLQLLAVEVYFLALPFRSYNLWEFYFFSVFPCAFHDEWGTFQEIVPQIWPVAVHTATDARDLSASVSAQIRH